MCVKYRKIHRQSYIVNYSCTYSIFVVCAEFYVVTCGPNFAQAACTTYKVE